MKACELRAERGRLYDSARELGERAGRENREYTADERVALDETLAKLDRMAADISRLERLEVAGSLTEGEWRAQNARISDPLPHEMPGQDGRYSLTRAILRAADGHLDGLEGECHQEIVRRIGKKSAGPLGFFMPTRHRMAWNTHRNTRVGGRRLTPGNGQIERRIDDTTAAAGAVLTRWDTTWIEFLRTRMVLDQLGIRVLTEMHGNFQMPRQSGVGTVSWVAESTAVGTTGQTIDQVLFTPKTVGCFTDMSRRFLEQLSIDPEEFVRQDLAAVVARGIEAAAYNGTGAPQPTGILQLGGITSVSNGTNGGYPTMSTIIQMEEVLMKANADMGNLAYVFTPAGKATLKQIPRQFQGQTSYFPLPIFADDGTVNTYDAYSTNLLPSNLTKGTGTNLSAAIFARWEEAILAFWSAMDVLVDPFTGGAAGTIRVVVLQDCDFQVRHVPSFAIMSDVQTY